MSDLERPGRLPERFGEIWEALREADADSPSRQALALKMGVSTHTIQRILVDGNVPRLEETKNTRIRRAWVRILTRLAIGMDRMPREWIESVGIPFDDDAARICKVEALKVRAKRGDPVLAPVGATRYGRITSEAIAAAPGRDWPARIDVGLAVRGGLSGHLDIHGGSFLEVFTRRLVGAVNPATRLRTESMEEDDVVRGLMTAGASLDIGVGITETVYRRYLGLSFVQIPGISMRLGAMCLKRRDAGGRDRDGIRRGQGAPGHVPDWRHVILPGGMKDRYFLVTAGSVAHDYLTGQCRIASEEIIVRSVTGSGQIAGIFLEETGKRPDHWVIFVDGDDVCALIADNLEGTRGFSKRYSIEDLPGAEEECPRYPVGIALRTGAGHWSSLLEAARDVELLGGSARRTANLYASLMIACFLDRNPDGLPEAPRLGGMVEITDFRKATPEFQEVLFRNLVVGLKRVLLARLELEGTAESADALDSRATERAAAYAEALIPREWLRAIEESLIRTKEAEAHGSFRPAASQAPGEWLPWCRSCSISLEDEHNRGISEHFCRFCSDEEGKLKSRSKVQNLIARWFERWQENLNHDEAMRRAGLFMMAMPAWPHN